MKSPYFEFITIEQKIIQDFLSRHQQLIRFVKSDEPFYVRIYKKIYAGLLHMIISQDETNDNVIRTWDKLLNNVRKIKPKNVNKIEDSFLIETFGYTKAKLIRQVTLDVINGKLNLKSLLKLPEQDIENTLAKYSDLTSTTIQDFLIFGFFKKDVLCDKDPDFINGLKNFLGKQIISQDDINNIKIEYKGEQTLFSLCMWKIKNESVR